MFSRIFDLYASARLLVAGNRSGNQHTEVENDLTLGNILKTSVELHLFLRTLKDNKLQSYKHGFSSSWVVYRQSWTNISYDLFFSRRQLTGLRLLQWLASSLNTGAWLGRKYTFTGFSWWTSFLSESQWVLGVSVFFELLCTVTLLTRITTFNEMTNIIGVLQNDGKIVIKVILMKKKTRKIYIRVKEMWPVELQVRQLRFFLSIRCWDFNHLIMVTAGFSSVSKPDAVSHSLRHRQIYHKNFEIAKVVNIISKLLVLAI